MTETTEKQKVAFTQVTEAGKTAINHITKAIKTDSSAELIDAIGKWTPAVVGTLIDTIFSKAKVWEHVDNNEQLAFLKNMDYSIIFKKPEPKSLSIPTPTVPRASPSPNPAADLFPTIHQALVSLEAGQIATNEKLNTIISTDLVDGRELEKLKKQTTSAVHFVSKYGDQVRALVR